MSLDDIQRFAAWGDEDDEYSDAADESAELDDGCQGDCDEDDVEEDGDHCPERRAVLRDDRLRPSE